jgi:hypothetical protein
MRTLPNRSLSFAALAILLFTGSDAAQDKSPALLNTLEVQQLIERPAPAHNARLAAHFTALAERYAAQAKRHTSMSQHFLGNPNRNLGTGMSVHSRQLASLNSQAAVELRELAAYHQKLAFDAEAMPSAAHSRFDGGAEARVPADQELNAMAAKASTPADHRALEEYFLTLAKRYTSEVADYTAMAQAYRELPESPDGACSAVVHGDRLVDLSRDAAQEASDAAAMHKQLAGVVR